MIKAEWVGAGEVRRHVVEVEQSWWLVGRAVWCGGAEQHGEVGSAAVGQSGASGGEARRELQGVARRSLA